MSTAKSVNISISISPVDGKGRRKVLVAGAPEGEMPVMHSGYFPELHDLVNQVWIEVQTRKKALVPKKTTAAAKVASINVSDEDDEKPEAAATPSEPETAPTPEPEPAEALPVIEGDDNG